MANESKKSKRPTILDIARAANVSAATVSRVLNDSDYPVKDELSVRIRKAAQELNYKPNIFSQMLKGVSSKEIGIIVPDLINPFYAQLVSAVARQCIKNGYAPIVCSSFDSSELENRQLEILLRQRVAGIILSNIGEIDYFSSKLNEHDAPPYVLFDQRHEGFSGNNVSFDFFNGGYMAANYLIQCGHKNIAFASHTIDRSSRKLIYDGYCKALTDAGLTLSSDMIFIDSKIKQTEDVNMDFDNGRLLGQMLLKCDNLPDAVMAINDITAIGIMDYLSQNGVYIPEDLSVIGFDNIPVASMVRPALTTIHQPAVETGNKAARMLFERIKNPKLASEQIIISPELIIRESVKNKKSIDNNKK